MTRRKRVRLVKWVKAGGIAGQLLLGSLGYFCGLAFEHNSLLYYALGAVLMLICFGTIPLLRYIYGGCPVTLLQKSIIHEGKFRISATK